MVLPLYCRGLLFLCLAASLPVGPTECSAEVPLATPIEFQPYTISVEVTTRTADAVSKQLRAETLAALPATIDRCIGSRWLVTWPGTPVTLPSPVTASDPATTIDPTAETSTENTAESTDAVPVVPPLFDVEYRIQLSTVPGQITAVVSAYEPLWSRKSPAITITTGDVRELPGRLVAAMQRLFRPKGLWQRLDESQVQLRIQGAAFALPDPELPLLKEVELFTPWMVFYTREGTVQRLVPIPWTLLELRDATEGHGLVTIHSGLANALGTSPRGRVKLIAVAERVQWPDCELVVLAQSRPPQPLVAHRVQLSPEEAPPEEAISLMTNRHGRVLLPVDGPHPWLWVTVTSGDQRLAEVPLVPGAERQITLDVPDDRLRLRTEGQLRLLQGELVASVAERQGLMLAARAAAKRNAWDEVARLTRDLNELTTIEKFRDQLAGIRVSAVAEARQQQNRLAERRVQRMCDETQQLITRYLADDKVRLLLEELAELKATVESEAPAK